MQDWASRYREQEETGQERDWAERYRIPPTARREQVVRQEGFTPIAGINFRGGPTTGAGGRAPIMRALGAMQYDTPDEMDAYIQRRYGPNAVLRRGSDIPGGLLERNTPAGESWFLRPDLGAEWELYDPSADFAGVLASNRGLPEEELATAQPRGFAGAVGGGLERIAETAELGTEFSPEIVTEGAIMGASSLGGPLAAGSQFSRRAPALARLLRSTASAGSAATGTALSQTFQQYYQTQTGTQRQTPGEQQMQTAMESLFAGGGSYAGDAVSMVLGRMLRTGVGAVTPEGEEALRAIDEFNQLIDSGVLGGEDIERIAPPIFAALSDAPAAQRIVQYLSRLTPEIQKSQSRMRATLREVAEEQAEIPSLSGEEMFEGLRRVRSQVEDEIRVASRTGSVEESGMRAWAVYNAYRQEMSRHFSEEFAQATGRLPNDFDIKYDWEPIRAALTRGNEARTIDVQRIDVAGELPHVQEGARRMETGTRQTWNTWSELEGALSNAMSGTERYRPEGMVRMVQRINDELKGAEVSDSARASLVNLKQALLETLETMPAQNPGMADDVFEPYLNASRAYREYQASLDTMGVQALARSGAVQDFYGIGHELYVSGNPSRLQQVRDVLLEAEGGREAWDDIRMGYLAHSLDTPGSPLEMWDNMPREARAILFDPSEHDALRSQLRRLDAVRSTINFERVSDLYGTSEDFVRQMVDAAGEGGDPRRLEQVRQALDAAGGVRSQASVGFEGGVWQYLLRESMTDSPQGAYVDPDAFRSAVSKIRESGVYELMSIEQRRNISNMSSALPVSTFDLSDNGTSLAAAAFASRLISPSEAPQAILELGFMRLEAAAMVAQSGNITSLMRPTEANVIPMLGRMTGYLQDAEADMSEEDYRNLQASMGDQETLRTRRLADAVQRTPF